MTVVVWWWIRITHEDPAVITALYSVRNRYSMGNWMYYSNRRSAGYTLIYTRVSGINVSEWVTSLTLPG